MASRFGFNDSQKSDSNQLDPAPIGSHLVEIVSIRDYKIKDPSGKRPVGEPYFKCQYLIVVPKPTSNEVPCDPGDEHEQLFYRDQIGKTNVDLIYLFSAVLAAEFDSTTTFPFDRTCLSPDCKIGRIVTGITPLPPGFYVGPAVAAVAPVAPTDDDPGKPGSPGKPAMEYFNILASGVTLTEIQQAMSAKMTIICVEEILLARWRPSSGKYLQLKRSLAKSGNFPIHRWQPMSAETRAWIRAGGIEKAAMARANRIGTPIDLSPGQAPGPALILIPKPDPADTTF